MKNKKKDILIIIVILLVVITLGITYAYWQVKFTQEKENIVTMNCLKIKMENEDSPINLEKAHPISDQEGLALKPFTFTLKNECDSYASYEVNFEILNTSTLKSEYVKVALNDKILGTLGSLTKAEPTIKDEGETSNEAYKLKEGYLDKNESVDFNLRLWMDGAVEDGNATSGKIFEGKITITPSYEEEIPSKADMLCEEYGEDNANCKLMRKAESDTTNLTYDDTKDENLRYIGATPNNYVYFNCEDNAVQSSSTCETWRIIGVMNNVTEVSEDGQNKETNGAHIKIIRNTIFNKLLSWDSSAANINSGKGINEWSQADIEKVLNDEYLNRRTGSNLCYDASSNTTETCPDWANIGIKDEARSMIANIKWNTGTMPVAYSDILITASYMYEAERSDHNGKEQCSGGANCNDIITRTTTWIGKVGLMYPSDYGYAVGGEVRKTCLEKRMTLYNVDCFENDWLYINNSQWTITPVPDLGYTSYVFHVYSNGFVTRDYASDAYSMRPTVYIKSDVKIKQNDAEDYGSKDNPFILEY